MVFIHGFFAERSPAYFVFLENTSEFRYGSCRFGRWNGELIMKIKKELIKREIAGDCILVPVGKSTLESNGLFALNELGAFIWDILAGAETEEEIVTAVLKEYEIDRETAVRDISEFLRKLESMEII